MHQFEQIVFGGEWPVVDLSIAVFIKRPFQQFVAAHYVFAKVLAP
jgi:hypothetical protein